MAARGSLANDDKAGLIIYMGISTQASMFVYKIENCPNFTSNKQKLHHCFYSSLHERRIETSPNFTSKLHNCFYYSFTERGCLRLPEAMGLGLEAGCSLANDDDDDDEAIAASSNTRTPDQTNKNSITGFILLARLY